jgi:hypothetical protein
MSFQFVWPLKTLVLLAITDKLLEHNQDVPHLEKIPELILEELIGFNTHRRQILFEFQRDYPHKNDRRRKKRIREIAQEKFLHQYHNVVYNYRYCSKCLDHGYFVPPDKHVNTK